MTLHRVPAQITPPGRIVARELEARGWTQRHLATLIGRPVQAINQIVKGSKQITPETALVFGEVFGTSAEFWANLEMNYRLNLARQKQNESLNAGIGTSDQKTDDGSYRRSPSHRQLLPRS